MRWICRTHDMPIGGYAYRGICRNLVIEFTNKIIFHKFLEVEIIHTIISIISYLIELFFRYSVKEKLTQINNEQNLRTIPIEILDKIQTYFIFALYLFYKLKILIRIGIIHLFIKLLNLMN